MNWGLIHGFGLALALAACGRVSYSPIASDADVAPDSSPLRGACPDADDATLALFSFDTNLEENSAGPIDSIANPIAESTEGPTGCGQAIRFPGSLAFSRIPQSPDWQLPEGSLEFWFLATSAGEQGLVSRDALNNDEDGHFLISFVEQRFVLRLQSIDAGYAVWLCSEPQELMEWHRVQVNFGPPQAELYVNGTLATPSSTVVDSTPLGDEPPCGMNNSGLGITGNDNVWVFGASSYNAASGEPEPVGAFPVLDGAIDHLMISSVRRDFTQP